MTEQKPSPPVPLVEDDDIVDDAYGWDYAGRFYEVKEDAEEAYRRDLEKWKASSGSGG